MARKEKQFHFIYKTTNILSKKYYIGMHSTNNLDDDYLGSGKRLRYSVNKYGKENHIREIIEFCSSREELQSKEKLIVNLNEIAKKECMNLTVGGHGGFTSDQQRKNAYKSNKKQKKLREENPEWVLKKSRTLSESQKKTYEDGRTPYHFDWSGKKHKEETKRKIGNANSLLQKGTRNSQFGTCWITNGFENKKIKKENLTEFLSLGWKTGRI